ncbi:MAG TPA: Gfo/Idh/MocA family oxidoreductase, partial [Tepidisphaeraceae bacterium]|nr:Gfo/Idh/MocA family oxidoreductase [Tepidisphaeraceae bacterium]
VDLVAAASGGEGDSTAAITEWCGKNDRAPTMFDNWREMLDAVKPDAAVVCGPFELHAEMISAAMQRGIHVFAEKPCALTFDDLAAIRQCAEAHPAIHLAAMMQSRYDPGFYTAWRLIGEGAIGEVRLINARKAYKRGQRADYYRNRQTYGGTIPWVGSHAIDWMLWFAGVRPESVTAAQSRMHNGGIGTMESSAACLFRLAGERIGTVSIDVLRPENATAHGDDWIRAVGSAGVIEARPDRITLINAGNDGTLPVAVACDRKPFADFIQHIRGERNAIIGAPETINLTEALLLAQQSADEQREVYFPQQ